MRRLTWIGAVALAALVGAGLAVAHGRGAKGIDPVAATFTATSASKTTRTCTGPDGTYEIARARYEGTSTGDARLTGRITVRTKTIVNTTTGHGWTTGSAVIRNAEGRRLAWLHLAGVNSSRTALNGFATGHARTVSDAAPGGRVLANFTATLNSTLTGSLGSGASPNTAIVYSGACNKQREARRRK